ncbi:ATP-dependent helicase HrpB [Colwellia sp. 4_MG-2023]|uniref:ATP-dependent helicase HrpB n=1 Tax=Colwellia sp. 5_MG-2023 TaxID=3062673 RepID=UPI0026E12323|nr:MULTISPECIES: ATP-dependent helicase HrpB [unclassified Colwellia]MDO6508328.1 ATP-dependent helicase HrpB [Colwellia sp. 5_MG-2023]MDO6556930.1 ATP-dependent helicase HrpB [Colwellia sp. 4_MG-2023]
MHNILAGLLRELKNNPNVVLQAEPGAGKSTVVPLELLNADFLHGQRIIMLEPRRMAARSIANYLAKCLGEKVGETVGYQVKNDKKISAATRLEILTEGVLTRRLQSNPELDGVGLIIFDEFHERSINTDLSLMLSLEIQQVIREDLRLLVMSATLDTNLVSKYLDDAPVMLCKGRAYPVSVSHQKTDNRQLASNVCKAISNVIQDEGDILVFLPGVADIKRCISQATTVFSAHQNLKLIALYGALPLEEQERAIALAPQGTRKVIFTTNIAETSLTIEGITCVIDSGLEKTLIFNPSSGMSKLTTTTISKASAEQRKGRAGRLSQGKCLRLWSESEHRSLKDYQEEEILNADLADAVLELASAGHASYAEINWLTPPPKAHYDSTQDLLVKLGMLDTLGKITALGKKASGLPIHPRLAKMMLAANDKQEREIACNLAALLSERDILQGGGSADLLMRLQVLIESDTDNINKAYVNRNTLKTVVRDVRTLQSLIQHKKSKVDISGMPDIAAYLLLLAFPERLAKRRSANSHKYQLANGKGVYLAEEDPLINNEYLVVNDCDAQTKEGRVFSAITFNKHLLVDKFSHQISEKIDYELAANNSRVYARRLKKYGSLIIEETRSNDVPAEFILDSIQSLIKTDAKSILHWTQECEDWLKRVEWLGSKMEGFPVLSEALIMESAENWLLPYITNIKKISELKQVKILPLLSSLLTYEESKILEQEAPITYTTPSNKKVSILYDKNSEPTVAVVLQELFGELASPMLAGNSVALRFELLSPARRPIQITSDLANFWGGSYVEVAKDMRAKYPRHRWPIDPFSEKAGRSIKPK